MEHGGLCSALIRRRTRFDSWHLDHPAQAGLEDWPSGKAAVSKTVVGARASRRFDPCILRHRAGTGAEGRKLNRTSSWLLPGGFGVRVPGGLPQPTQAPVVQRKRRRRPKPAIQVRLLVGALLPLRCNRLHARLLTGRTRFEPWWGSSGERAGAQVILARSLRRVRHPCSPPRARVAQRPERPAHIGEAPGSSPGMRTTVP